HSYISQSNKSVLFRDIPLVGAVTLMKVYPHEWSLLSSKIYLGPDLTPTSNVSCTDYVTCTSCVGYTDRVECLWCAGDAENSVGTCMNRSTAGEDCGAGSLLDICTGNVASYVTVLILSALLCCCCGIAMLRKFLAVWHGRRQWGGNLSQPLLDEEEEQRHEAVFRNSLTEAGEQPWWCPVCGFDNRPRCKNCDLCGTSKDFAKAYTQEKLSRGSRQHVGKGMKALKGTGSKGMRLERTPPPELGSLQSVGLDISTRDSL
ncbi:unnamed protein product, partial [Choristocarpus tenellus]